MLPDKSQMFMLFDTDIDYAEGENDVTFTHNKTRACERFTDGYRVFAYPQNLEIVSAESSLVDSAGNKY